ncbi:MAG: transporter substrate-binding domain-containing protein [Syntrophobacteraceae bacterium]
MKRIRLPALLIPAMVALLLCHSAADAGDTLTRMKARGKVRCGVSDGIPGLSFKGPDGRWSGMDVDFCHALAAAVLGDPGKVEFVSLTAAARFPSLKAGEVDVLCRNTTWTLEREARLEVMFAGILFFDGQSFLVPARKAVYRTSPN